MLKCSVVPPSENQVWNLRHDHPCIRDRDRLPRVGVVEREIPALLNLQLFRSRGLGTLELSSRDKSLADCQFPGNLGQRRDS